MTAVWLKAVLATAWRKVGRGIAAALLLSASLAAPLIAAEPIDEDLLRQAFPGAEAFGTLEGEPPAVPAYRGGRLTGYVFSSWQVVRSTGYSAKPLDLLVGLGLDGVITGVVIAQHHEPILIIGVDDADLEAFVAQYKGLDIRQPVRLEEVREDGSRLAGVSGATISSLVMNDAVLRSARAVARSRGLLGEGQAKLRFADFEPGNWVELVSEGSLRRLLITVGAARAAIEAGGGRLFVEGMPVPPDDAVFLELFAGLATPARVGRNLLGERRYGGLMAERGTDDQLLFVAGRGLFSFKGRNYRRSGVFERLQLVQGNRAYRFGTADHFGFESLPVDGGPELREIALFSLPAGRGFDPAQPWRLQVLVPGVEEAGVTPSAIFELPYRLPERFLATAPTEGTAWRTTPLWQESWRGRAGEILVLAFGLLVLSGILVFQGALVRNRNLHLAVRICFLVYTVVWIGWIAGAQLSVVNVLTFLDALMTEFSWEFFLLEPLIFMLWGYVAIAILFWGRGVFCGWLCPFGALQELVNRGAQRLGVPQWRLPFGLHERLWPIKYIAFIALFATFLYDPALALTGAEIEPFKTAIVLKFQRSWPYVAYAAGLLVASLFVSRAFCRYLCPMGAALALPARLSMFEWLKRRWQCGTPCQSCAQTCPVQAIHPEGKINPNECIHCLTCQVNYSDEELCPPLVERKRRRERAQRAKDGSKGQPEAPAASGR